MGLTQDFHGVHDGRGLGLVRLDLAAVFAAIVNVEV